MGAKSLLRRVSKAVGESVIGVSILDKQRPRSDSKVCASVRKGRGSDCSENSSIMPFKSL